MVYIAVMPLSPRDIRSQSFKKAFLGYRSQDVDFFIEEIAKSVEDLRREIDNLIAEKEHSLERIGNYESQTSAVKETLELAREKGANIIEESKGIARELIADAKVQAENILLKYQDEFNHREMKLQRLISVTDTYKRRFGLMLDDTLRKIEELEKGIDSRKAREHLKEIPDNAMIKEPIQEWEWAHNSRFMKRK